jgi:hypothetical protein
MSSDEKPETTEKPERPEKPDGGARKDQSKAERKEERREARAEKAERRRRTGSAAMVKLRDTVARAVKLVFVVLAAILALGALLVVLQKNVSADNPIVKFVLDVADHIDGPLGRKDGIFVFHGKNGAKWDAVVNWGLAAVVYLVIGNVLHRVIAPSSTPKR